MEGYIYNLTGKIFEGGLESLTAPAEGGEITVLKGHMPVITTLKAGILHLTTKHETTTHKITRGVLAVDQKKVLVLVE